MSYDLYVELSGESQEDVDNMVKGQHTVDIPSPTSPRASNYWQESPPALRASKIILLAATARKAAVIKL